MAVYCPVAAFYFGTCKNSNLFVCFPITAIFMYLCRLSTCQHLMQKLQFLNSRVKWSHVAVRHSLMSRTKIMILCTTEVTVV